MISIRFEFFIVSIFFNFFCKSKILLTRPYWSTSPLTFLFGSQTDYVFLFMPLNLLSTLIPFYMILLIFAVFSGLSLSSASSGDFNYESSWSNWSSFYSKLSYFSGFFLGSRILLYLSKSVTFLLLEVYILLSSSKLARFTFIFTAEFLRLDGELFPLETISFPNVFENFSLMFLTFIYMKVISVFSF